MFVYWRARVASETVFGVDNAKSGICYVCIYVWIVRMPFKRASGERFFLKKHGLLVLTPVYSETTALSKIPAKTLAFQETKS